MQHLEIVFGASPQTGEEKGLHLPPIQDEVQLSMMNLLQIIRKLAPWQKVVVVGMLILILMTWLAVCLILGSYMSF